MTPEIPRTTHCTIRMPSIPEKTIEMLDYIMRIATESEGISYSSQTGLITYHVMILPHDREFYPELKDVSEVWIFEDAQAYGSH